MPLKVKEAVLALPTAVAPVTPTVSASPISTKAIVPAPAALLIVKALKPVVPPIVPPTETAPAPEVIAKVCAPLMVEVNVRALSVPVVLSVLIATLAPNTAAPVNVAVVAKELLSLI